MIAGLEHYGKMTEQEQKAYRANLSPYMFSKITKKKYRRFIAFLDDSFVWERSNEGKEFWKLISEKYE